MNIEDIGKSIINCSFKVHTTLGAGLLERAYETYLVHELRKTGLLVEQ
jgi:GxxExxY protein